MDYKENLYINVIDLSKSVLKHWKAMVTCAVIGATALGMYGYVGSGVTIDSETGEPYTEVGVSEYVSLREALSEEDAVLAEETAYQYLNYAKEYARVLEYGESSIALKIDSRNVPEVKTSYSIKENMTKSTIDANADSTDRIMQDGLMIKSDVSNIASAYALALKDDSVIEEIKNESGIDADNSAISELISVGTSGSSILTVSVIGTDKGMCEAIMPVLEKKIEETTEKIKNNYDYEISKIDTYYTIGNNSTVDSLQREYNGYLYNIRSSMNGLASVLTPEQKEYYTALIAHVNVEKLKKNEGDITITTDLVPLSDSPQEPVNTEIKRSVNLKYIGLGAFGGAFIVAAIFAAFYILSGKLHTAEDLRNAFELSVIGDISGTEDKKIGVITSEIGLAASNIEASKICIIGAAIDDAVSKLRETIANDIRSKNSIKSCEACNDVINSIADMETMSESDAVVLVEKKNSSRYEDIAKELELCNKYGVKVLGAVIMD
ncbi:MAG: hypothetical protein J5802_14890 [Butyrivibrio sp.]|nr:hypothetical protein [Butyrivibrio sp.]